MFSLVKFALLVIQSVLAFDVRILNNCSETLWPALYGTDISSCDLIFPKTPYLNPGNSTTIRLRRRDKWSGRIWARSRCSEIQGGTYCEVGNCANMSVCHQAKVTSDDTTLVELTLDGEILDYDISIST